MYLFKSGYNDVHAAPALSRLGQSLKGAIWTFAPEKILNQEEA